MSNKTRPLVEKGAPTTTLRNFGVSYSCQTYAGFCYGSPYNSA